MYAFRRIPLSRMTGSVSWRCGGPCTRRVVAASLAAVVLYFALYPRVYHYSVSYRMEDAPPKVVWEFVADFSNMPKLNPTILTWELISESGNYGHWQYTVRYTEFLSGLRFLNNYAIAHYQVKPPKSSGGDFVILSSHTTCFYTDMLCLPSASEFRFSPLEGGASTACSEDIHYACPWLFDSFCRKEVMIQRQAIRDNLRAELSVQQ